MSIALIISKYMSTPYYGNGLQHKCMLPVASFCSSRVKSQRSWQSSKAWPFSSLLTFSSTRSILLPTRQTQTPTICFSCFQPRIPRQSFLPSYFQTLRKSKHTNIHKPHDTPLMTTQYRYFL